ncbi:MAG: UvrD-helicase domain-containing protein [Acidobacteria bacterium]|nr:UvrD-helicase domain-containing protein [Acidobacteriota bacterium]
MRLPDQQARNLIRSKLDATLVVEAAAGTGKTTELVHRIISVLASGRTTVDRIVAVTFTDKAAGELKLRLRSELEKARTAAQADAERSHHLEEALAHLEEARAGTIHSFCGDLLRERPVEAAIDPEFEQLDDIAAEQHYRAAFRGWIERTLENPGEGVRRSLRRYSQDEKPMMRLQRAGWTLASWRDFDAEWKRPAFDRGGEIGTLVDELHSFARLTRTATDPGHVVYQQTRAARDLSDYIDTVEKSRARDNDGLEARLIELAKSRDFRIARKGAPSYGPGLPRDQVIAAHSRLLLLLREFAARADADLAALLASELRDSIAAYDAMKRRTGKLDFFDLLVRARNLLRDNAGVRDDLQRRFTHIFVDEFQDTEPLQVEVLMLLASVDAAVSDWRRVSVVPGKLFIVGDPKQAIYRFRRADVALYYEVKDRLVSCGALALELTTSFRSVPFIQNFVNSAFTRIMDTNRETLQAEYVPLTPHREQPSAQPSVVALSVPEPYSLRGVTGVAVEKSLPDAVGAFVDWVLTKSGWSVTERGAGEERVQVQARHICLMFRRFEKWMTGDITRAYSDAFQARGIAHVLVGGKSFHEREEVGTMRAALSALEWPDDALSVYATLRGSLFAINDADLLAYRTQFGYWHPFRIPQDVPQHLRAVKHSLEVLRELSRRRNLRPIVETIHQLLTATRAHAGFVMRPAGEQALANVLHIAELARQYESRGAVSFRGFLEELIEAAEEGKQPEATIYEEGSEGVRMMSVHRAKGLEFPIVILADITCKIARDDPDRHLDAERRLCAVKLAGWTPQDVVEHAAEEHGRDLAEGVRIAYVAATRARDVLVVPVIGDDPTGSGPQIAESWWVAPLYSALYPAEPKRANPARACMCPDFGIDSVLKRPDGEPANETTVRPGAHGFGAGASAYNVVWWDPKTLDLGKAPSFSIRQQELLEKGNDDVVERRLEHYQRWKQEREDLLSRGSVPGICFETASERAKSRIPVAGDVQVIEISREARPVGPRFGTLVHTILASIALDAGEVDIAATAQLEGRILGAPYEEVRAAVTTVKAALQHPLLERARESAARGECYRELPLTWCANGVLIEGVADLVFGDHQGWSVVDFKTDQELATELERYRRQVLIYAAAISKARHRESAAFLFRV